MASVARIKDEPPPATLAAAMALAFGEIEGATKSANNPHFKSKYADLTAVIDAIKPALIKHGLFFTQCPVPSEGGVQVETVLHHSSGEHLSLGSLFVPANKQDAQGYGSALTYARRYALVTAFGVPVEDDDGNAASRHAPIQRPQAAPTAQPLTDAEWAKLVQLCQATGTQGDEVKNRIGAANLRLLTPQQFTEAVDFLETKLADLARSETNAKVPA